MKSKKSLKNIYVDVNLSLNQRVFLSSEVSERLKKVMRFKKGWEFAVFNAKDGLFLAEILSSDCSEISLKEQLKPQANLTQKVLFLPILKREALSNAVRQSTELGIDIIQPIITEFTVENSFKHQRYEQIVMGACEQSERLTIPKIRPVLNLQEAIDKFENNIFWACERSDAASEEFKFSNVDGVLVGPEGGFSESEKEYLSSKQNVITRSLGDSILKADTAVVVALARFMM
ncbi:MAG: 16S rRNA (uracil(1498)-N(3))-methyltransferase [Proteobacteria bacterium]|nr:16S rRNA (uracil(1498)-N(3))-methyltransferase [Pseudomonadota bacterium]